MFFKVFAYCCFYSIKHYTVTTNTDQRCVGFKFCQHMVVGVVGVEAVQHTRVVGGNGPNLLDDIKGYTGALNHLYRRGHRVVFNGSAVVGTDIYVNA